jgi:hypothetical protein
MLPREFGELLATLERSELPYVVVGGVAVNLLGYERATRADGRRLPIKTVFPGG